MQPEFWHERWRTGQIGFHQPQPDQGLVDHWHDLKLPTNARVFVPLCGKSMDLVWLHAQGHSLIGVEMSDIALEAFCLENGIPARRRTLTGFERYEAPGYQLYCGDFFALSPHALDGVTAVYDRASLISWADELRGRYVQHMTELTRPGTQTLLLTMEYNAREMNGPPFPVTATDIETLYGRHHNIEQLSRQDLLPSEPRLKARGLTALERVCFRLTRT